MPVQLPNPPTGPTLLPPPPQDPPTLVDISNAAVYNKQILDSYGKACFSFFCWNSPFLIDMPCYKEAGIATRDDVGAGAIYQAAVIARNADGGQGHPLVPSVAPPWFAPAVAASLAPLTRFSYIVSLEIQLPELIFLTWTIVPKKLDA